MTPKIKDIETAIRIYHSCIEIGNAEINELFGVRSSAVFSRLKKSARKFMIENNVYQMGSYTVNTKCAYKAWGLDIDDLEARYKKLQKLKLNEKPKSETATA